MAPIGLQSGQKRHRRMVVPRSAVTRDLRFLTSFGMTNSKRGFTFIEILLTLTVIAVLFVPLMELFSHSLFATTQSLDKITAASLAKSEMEKIINLNYTKAQLRDMGEQWIPPLEGDPLMVNKSHWRLKREAIEGTDPIEVRVHAYQMPDMDKPVVSLVTLFEDMMWGVVKQGEAQDSED